MRMMRVPECLQALDGKISSGRLYYGIRQGIYRSARIGGVLVVDLDSVLRDLPKYQPRRAYPSGLVSFAELLRQTGLTRHQAERGVAEGWIKPVVTNKRKLYDLQKVQHYIAKQLGGDER